VSLSLERALFNRLDSFIEALRASASWDGCTVLKIEVVTSQRATTSNRNVMMHTNFRLRNLSQAEEPSLLLSETTSLAWFIKLRCCMAGL